MSLFSLHLSVLNLEDGWTTAMLLNNKSLIKRKMEFSLVTMLIHPSHQREEYPRKRSKLSSLIEAVLEEV
jgi:hypothetical protein